MRLFPIEEFRSSTYKETIFSKLRIIDDRNHAIIESSPKPEISRVSVIVENTKRVGVWYQRKLDGTPDFRFLPAGTIRGDSWISFLDMIEGLEKVEKAGNLCHARPAPAYPVMVSAWPHAGKKRYAAFLTAVAGLSALPIYFDDDFEVFQEAFQILLRYKSEIIKGTALSERWEFPQNYDDT